jgi:membrane-associated phospholipid phosphatase
VPLWLLGVFAGAIPFGIIIIVTLVFVPGAVVPRHTPAGLIWRRKLWEFHVCTLGFVTAHIIAFFFTQGMKNLFGRPRPDLLSRCQPDVDNAIDHIAGGFTGQSTIGQLYSASICQQEDAHILDDGFRSYPSGHSSASAAGLVYLSLLLASKLTVGIPFVLPGASSGTLSHAAFPSRMVTVDPLRNGMEGSGVPAPASSKSVYGSRGESSAKSQSLRNQAAAPPLYLLAIVLAPFALSIYICASRWFDFRHHAFDILFGYFIGLIAAIYTFRYYHLPISGGAGWAWGPRSNNRAFWAGVGRIGYGSQPIDEGFLTAQEADQGHLSQRPTNNNDLSGSGPGQYNSQANNFDTHASGAYGPNNSHNPRAGGNLNDYFDVEMQRMDNRN